METNGSSDSVTLLAYLCFFLSAGVVAAFAIGFLWAGTHRGTPPYQANGLAVLLGTLIIGFIPIIIGGLLLGVLLSLWAWFKGRKEWGLALLSLLGFALFGDYIFRPGPPLLQDIPLQALAFMWIVLALALPSWKVVMFIWASHDSTDATA